jgi:hypothetical protein
MKKISVPLVAFILWFMCSWALDTYVLHPACELCSDLFSVKFELVFREAAKLTTKRVSLLIFLVIPWFAYAFVVIPYRQPHALHAWRVALQRWCQPVGVALGTIGLALLIEYFIYLPVKDHLPELVRGYAERYQLTVYPLFPALEEFVLPIHLVGLIGLFWGLYAFLTKAWTLPDATR